ncbi:hypothetical protein JG688_00005152 [Phytophthora aleatoria]|uniref:Sepiapterin reductase n=1 Tax=Phytophthora aleatoria TaxID=2496075 RepID=A0A8J5M6S8_9STRA|nr:hypothetical protein JG688_00005152 [Phytophthora aleatoria]
MAAKKQRERRFVLLSCIVKLQSVAGHHILEIVFQSWKRVVDCRRIRERQRRREQLQSAGIYHSQRLKSAFFFYWQTYALAWQDAAKPIARRHDRQMVLPTRIVADTHGESESEDEVRRPTSPVMKRLRQKKANRTRSAEKVGEESDMVTLSDAVEISMDVKKRLLLLGKWKSRRHYETVFLVHNAAALGSLGFAQECPSPSEMARHFELNVTSVMWLNKRFLDVFGASRSEMTKLSASDDTTKLVFFHVSSRSAIAPYPTLSQYCTAKAAREMHFHVLAAEQERCHKVRVFSYSPGTMDTEMQQTMRESPLMAPELTKWFVEMKEKGTLIPTQQSSHRGVVVTVSGDFESGKHVTFDDLNNVV